MMEIMRTEVIPNGECDKCNGTNEVRLYILIEKGKFGTPEAARHLCKDCVEEAEEDESE
jgi:hypothetical protein